MYHVILHDIAHQTLVFKQVSASADAGVFSNGNLHVVDVALVKKRLAKLDQISEKLLAQDKAKRPTARDVLEFVKDESIA